MTGMVDPALLATSDVLVLEALTRAWARTVKRSGRGVPAVQRHTQYLHATVPVERVDAVMHDAWVLCGLLAHRHGFYVDPAAWAQALDSYTRSLLLMGQPHSPTRLAGLLTQLDGADRNDTVDQPCRAS